jgi:HlyD family secretion protein
LLFPKKAGAAASAEPPAPATPRRPRRRRAWALWLVVAAAAAATLRLTVFAPRPVLVRVAEAVRGVVEQTVTNSRAGTVKARRRAKLSPENGGRALAIPRRKGEPVKAGEVVLQLDDALQRAQLALAEREAQAAGAQREQACLAAARGARESRRIARLADNGIVSVDLADQVRSAAHEAAAACTAARAGVERARAAVALARVQIEKMKLRAPFDGVVGDLAIELGEWTTPSPPGLPIPPVVELIDPASLYVSAPMDEVDSARMRAGQSVRVTVDSYPGRQFPGRVTRVAPYVQDVVEQNRTVEIEVELDDPRAAARLLPGTSADVEVVLESHADALRVPTPALIEGRSVLVLDGDVLVSRDVVIGLKNWDFTEITDGLRAGERVVTSLDRAEIKAGARVRVESGAR